MSEQNNQHLIKFLAASMIFFFIGSVHGVVQLMPDVRAWLDSIGSPYGGPGHMIDPLAHAHVNLIGGVMIFIQTGTYYLIPKLIGKPVWSSKMMTFSFWGTTIGIICFYSTLMIFGAWMGNLLLADDPAIEDVNKIYGPLAAISATIMGIGLWAFLLNALMSLRPSYRKS